MAPVPLSKVTAGDLLRPRCAVVGHVAGARGLVGDLPRTGGAADHLSSTFVCPPRALPHTQGTVGHLMWFLSAARVLFLANRSRRKAIFAISLQNSDILVKTPLPVM